jgi:hypothetical protein
MLQKDVGRAGAGAAAGSVAVVGAPTVTAAAEEQARPDSAVPPHLARDPEPFECPYSTCVYDCQKRAPVRVDCSCKRLVCRKCAGVAGCQPQGCGLCGTEGQEFDGGDCVRDIGVLLVLAAKVPDTDPYVDLWGFLFNAF